MNYEQHDKAPAAKRKSKKSAFQGNDNRKGKDRKYGGKREFKPPKKITEKYLHNSGLAYLQRFTASSMHFKTVMTRKIDKSCRHHEEQDREECLQMLDKTTEKFRELGLLDDEAYLKGMITSFRRRGLSARQIDARKKKIGPYDLNGKHEFQKALGIMGRAGYSFDTAQKIIKMSNEELQEHLDSIPF